MEASMRLNPMTDVSFITPNIDSRVYGKCHWMPVRRTRVLDQPANWYEWELVRNGIYFLNQSVPPHGRIDFFDFATRETTPILSLEKPASSYGGLAVSPDGRSLLYGQNELEDSYIM